MLKRYPQLQSGFLASSEKMLIKPIVPPQSAVGSLISGAPTHTQDEFFYCPAIDALVNEALQNPLSLRSYAFQDRLFSTIGEVFEKQSFASFVRLQENDLSSSSSHTLFLEETIRVALGEISQRSISVQTWCSLLSAANQSNEVFRSATLFRKITYSGFVSMTLADFLTAWVRNAGFADLLISMQALFGRRGIHAIYGVRY